MCYNIHLFQAEEEEEEEDEGDYYDDEDEMDYYDEEDEEHSYDDKDDEGEQSFHAKNFVSYMQKIILIAWIESI